MSKTATIRARVEPSLKDHVEKIFEKLGTYVRGNLQQKGYVIK